MIRELRVNSPFFFGKEVKKPKGIEPEGFLVK